MKLFPVEAFKQFLKCSCLNLAFSVCVNCSLQFLLTKRALVYLFSLGLSMQSTIFGQTKHCGGMGTSGGRLAKYPKVSGQPEDSLSFLADGSGLCCSFVVFSSFLPAGSALGSSVFSLFSVWDPLEVGSKALNLSKNRGRELLTFSRAVFSDGLGVTSSSSSIVVSSCSTVGSGASSSSIGGSGSRLVKQ